MTTVLFADRDGSSLAPLSDVTVPALFPIRSAPALERTLEALFAAGIRTALCVVGPRAFEVERRFGKGIRWGIALEYVRREESESPGDVLRRLEQRLDGDTLVVRGDVGTEGAIGDFVSAVEARNEPVVAAVAAGERARPLGLWRIQPQSLKKVELPREPADAGWKLGKDHAPLEVDVEVRPLDSLAAFWTADRASQQPAVSPRATVASKARLVGGTSVGEEAVVLEGADLSGVTVLPRTVVPAGVRIADAVVAQNRVVDPRSGAVSRLTDLLPPAGARAATPGAGSRLAALVLLVLSIPLWPIALVWSAVANAGHPTRPFRFAGWGPEGRREVKTFRFETGIPLFRDLPLLLSVLSGTLALSGVAPLAPEEEAALAEPWQKVRLEAPPGLLSRSRMVAPPSAPAEVARVVDSFDARRGLPGLVALGLSTLFSARAFTAPKEWNPDQLPDQA